MVTIRYGDLVSDASLQKSMFKENRLILISEQRWEARSFPLRSGRIPWFRVNLWLGVTGQQVVAFDGGGVPPYFGSDTPSNLGGFTLSKFKPGQSIKVVVRNKLPQDFPVEGSVRMVIVNSKRPTHVREVQLHEQRLDWNDVCAACGARVVYQMMEGLPVYPFLQKLCKAAAATCAFSPAGPQTWSASFKGCARLHTCTQCSNANSYFIAEGPLHLDTAEATGQLEQDDLSVVNTAKPLSLVERVRKLWSRDRPAKRSRAVVSLGLPVYSDSQKIKIVPAPAISMC